MRVREEGPGKKEVERVHSLSPPGRQTANGDSSRQEGPLHCSLQRNCCPGTSAGTGFLWHFHIFTNINVLLSETVTIDADFP